MPSHPDLQLAHPLTTKKLTLLIALLLLLVAACDSERAEPIDESPPDIEERLFLFAERYLPDEDLVAAIPADFELDKIVRYGSERHRNPWITVGVRLDGPVYARAIYYVHIEREDAKEMYERQTSLSRPYAGVDGRRTPRARSATDLDLANVCAAPSGRLWVCHSWKAKVYLVVQASTDANTPGHEPQTLLKAFAEVLDQNLPARFHELSR